MSKLSKEKQYVAGQRRQWDLESMIRAVNAVKVNGKALRQASREYGVPVATLKRRVDGLVAMDARPGPSTVLTREEEDKLCQYCLDMADMGYGLTIEDIKVVAYRIAAGSGRSHPFKEGSAGRDWYEGFLKRHPQLSLRKPEALSYARAKNANAKVVEDFFAKLAAVCARLNILSKPMQIFNADETGISKVHKSRMRVLAKRGQKMVWSLTSGERGRTHTLMVCASAAGYVVPPLIIFPRARMNDSLKVDAPPGTHFEVSPKGWINHEIFLRWLDFFIMSIPSARPVLLLYDGHSSHISIEVIQKARKNDIHLLCLPAHLTHLLQPLDVSVMSSLKLYFGKACKDFLAMNPGRVITEYDISGILGKAWPQALSPSNVMSGFCKTGIYPLNPGRISDHELAPSKVFEVSAREPEDSSSSEQHKTSSIDTSSNAPTILSVDEILKLPMAKQPMKQTSSLTSTAQCLTDSPFLDKLKERKAMREGKEKTKATSKVTKPKKTGTTKVSKTRARRGTGTSKVTKRKASRGRISKRRQSSALATKQAVSSRSRCTKLPLPSDTDSASSSDCECAICGLPYGSDEKLWIQCDGCKLWMHTSCVDLESDIPDVFLCDNC